MKPDLVADHVAKGRIQLLRDALGHGACGDAPGLGVANEFAGASGGTVGMGFGIVKTATTQSQCNFGELRGFPGACFTTHNDDLVGLKGCHDFFPPGRDRQVFWEINHKRGSGNEGQAQYQNKGFALSQ